MLIQNANTLAQATTPARLAGDGGPVAVVAPSNAQAPVAPVASKETPPAPAQLQHAVDSLNQLLKQANKNLEFTVDAETKDPVVKLVDSETGDVIRQYPSEEALSIARAIDSFQQGALLKKQA